MCAMAASRSATTRGRDVQGEVLGGVVLLGRRHHPVVAEERVVAVDRSPPRLQRGDDPRAGTSVGDVRVDQQRLGGVAHAGALGLGVEHDGQRLVQVGGGSTYTWQLPTPVSITGTVDSSTTDRISPAPPRGISTSTRPRARISALTASWRSPGTSWTTSAGRPAAPAAVPQHRHDGGVAGAGAATSPRSSTALPDLRQIPAASAVTLGRAS